MHDFISLLLCHSLSHWCVCESVWVCVACCVFAWWEKLWCVIKKTRVSRTSQRWFIVSSSYLHEPKTKRLKFLKKFTLFLCDFFSIKMLKVCTKVCVSLKHKLQREYIRVKNQKCSRCFDKTATPSSIQLGLQDLAPGLRVQRRQLPAAQLVRRPHVAEPSNQPVFLHKAADVVPHQDHLRTGNRKRSESSSAVSGWRWFQKLD